MKTVYKNNLILPVVLGVQSAGQDTALCNGELVYLCNFITFEMKKNDAQSFDLTSFFLLLFSNPTRQKPKLVCIKTFL